MKDDQNSDLKWPLFIAFCVAAVLCMIYLIGNEWGFEWNQMATMAYWAGKDGGFSEVFSNLLGPFVTAAAAGAAFYYAREVRAGNALTQKQVDVAEMGQYAERFANAAAMLNSESMPTREAGIFALRELAIATPEGYYFPVQDLLCSFMRDAGKRNREQAAAQNSEPEETTICKPCESDVISALRAFSDLRTDANIERETERGWKPDLQKTNFNKFPGHTSPINLQSTNLSEAQLQRADLTKAKLQRADLTKAKLLHVNLAKANLQWAYLHDADLDAALLSEAQLQNAEPIAAQLKEAKLNKAQCQGADFTYAELQGAYLEDAQFQGAKLTYAQLQYTVLTGAKLNGANLKSAQFLTGALQENIDWTDAKLSTPVWDKSEWPKGWRPSDVQKDISGDYFTFIRVEPVSSDGN